MNQAEGLKTNRFTLALLPAPLIFILHFLEESPGFVAWFNAHVPRGITPGLFWGVNVTALVITLLLACAERVSRSALTQNIALAWLGFLMLANAAFHVAASRSSLRFLVNIMPFSEAGIHASISASGNRLSCQASPAAAG